MSPTLIAATSGSGPQIPSRAPKSLWSENVLTQLKRAGAQPTDPISLMLYPPLHIGERIWRFGQDVCDELDLKGNPHPADRLHVSLFFLCRCRQLTCDKLDALAHILSSLSTPPFALGFDRLMSFGRTKGPLVLRGNEDVVVGVIMLQNELAAPIPKIGFAKDDRDYTPHLTLNYQDCQVLPRAIEIIRWTVEEIFLVCSLQGRGRHVRLGSWPLRAGAQLN